MREALNNEKAGEQLHVYLTGRVQGVGMRNFVQRIAAELRLTGFVRNLPDGRVESLAEGDSKALAEFVRLLQTIPVGRVDNVSVTRNPSTSQYHSFIIK